MSEQPNVINVALSYTKIYLSYDKKEVLKPERHEMKNVWLGLELTLMVGEEEKEALL